MTFPDILYVLQWWGVLFGLGLLFFYTTHTLFSEFIDKGYIFAKVIGIIVLSYTIYTLGTIRVIPFTYWNAVLLSILIPSCGLLFNKQYKKTFKNIFGNKILLYSILIEELLFLLTLFFWSYVRGFQPDIHGLEKYMDFGFVNSILKTSYFPAKDMWFAPFSINYYYFGHLVTAVLTKLSNIPSAITYNLMIASLFAFTFSCSFSIAINLLYAFYTESAEKKKKAVSYFKSFRIGGFLIAGSLISGYLVSLSGNLHTVYAFFRSYTNENPIPFWELPFLVHSFPNAYWYPNATRFIYNTIHEFPSYSFVVSDLHGHVLGIPIILTIIAFLFHIIISGSIFSYPKVLFLSFLIATAYMTNALDGPIYLLLTALVVFFHSLYVGKTIKQTILYEIPIVIILVMGFLFFSLPFSLNFNSFVSGIGILCAPDFLISLGKIGPLLFEAEHCQKSPPWQLFILYGFFWIWTLVLILKTLETKITKSDIFVLSLACTSLILIVLPEFIYFKDIYPAHYRANTMFKLGYQAFIMLSLVSGYSIFRSLSTVNFKSAPLYILGYIALGLVVIYPHFSIHSYYLGLERYQGLNGISYLQRAYSTDFAAIEWLNKNIPGQPTILEAQGESYTDFARVSTHTGLPTPLGWTVHEWLWRGSYSIPAPRISDIQLLYEGNDMNTTKSLLKKYDIKYIFIGSLERQKYLQLQEEKFNTVGKKVYSNGATNIYKIN